MAKVNFLVDPRLSLKAKGAMAIIVGLKIDRPTINEVSRFTSNGREVTIKVLNELEQLGYIERNRERSETGRFAVSSYVIHEEVEIPPQSTIPTAAQIDRLIDINNINNINNQSIYQSNNNTSNISAEPQSENETEAYDNYFEVIKGNVDYDTLVFDSPSEKQLIDELVCTMAEAVAYRTQPLRVFGNSIPASVVKSVFLKLDSDHLRFVVDSLKKNASRITNVKNYMLVTLYNSAFTIDNYFSNAINADMRGL